MKKIQLLFLSIVPAFILFMPYAANASIAVGWNATSTDQGYISPNLVNAKNFGLYVLNKIGIGTSTPNHLLTIFGTDSGTNPLVTTIVEANLINADQTVNNTEDFGFNMVNSIGQVVTAAKIVAVNTSHAAGAEASDLVFTTRNAGTQAERMRLTSAGVLRLPALASAAGTFIAADTAGNLIATTTPTSGGTPGGLNLQVQYNNAGAFGGISGAVTNGTILNLTNPLIGGATITTSSVNGVTLTTGGSATTFLNGAGSYTTPAGTVYTATYPITLTGNAFGLAFATSTLINAGTGISTSSTALGAITITNTGVISNSCPGGFLSCSGTNPSTFTLGTLGTANGGTASTTALGGILVGNGTSAIKSLLVGTGLSFDGTTLTATGGSSFSYPFPASATSSAVAFNGGLTASTFSIGSLTGTLNAAGGVVYSTATSTITTGTGIGYSGTMGSEIGGISGTLTNTGVTSIVAGTNISISGATGAVTINSTGGSGTNFFTQSGTTIAQNTGSIVSLGSVVATSTTATSTFAGDVAIGGSGGTLGTGALPNPNLFIGTSTTHTPLYGRIPGDLIDAELDWNGVSSINVANANIGTCAASTYFADGNNPTLGGYYATLSFLNDGWTDGAGAGCGIGASTLDKPEAAVLASPTGEMDFDIASTTQKGFADYHWNVNNVNKMTLTNAGNLGIGSSSPNTPLSISTINFDPTTGHDYLADFNVGVAGASDPSIQFSQISTIPATYNTMDVSDGGWNFYDATNTSEDTLNTTDLFSLSNTSAHFKITGATAFSVQPTGNTNNSFLINNSVANSATGLSITTAATGGTTVLVTTDSGANSSLTINAKGTGAIGLGTVSTGTVTLGNNSLTSVIGNVTAAGEYFFRFNGSNGATLTSSQFAIPSSANSSAVTAHFLFTGAADTALTASTEAPDVYFNLVSTRTHAAGAIATQRDFRITPSTHTFTAGTSVANATIASSTTFSIDGAPGQGALGNYTNAQAIFIGSTGYTSSTTNAFDLVGNAPTGATNNYFASTTGRWVVNGLTTSASTQSVIICGNTATGGELIAESIACVASAARYKTDVHTLTGSLAELMKLRPVSFKWKADFNKGYENDPNKNGTQYSLIADEVQKVDPNLVIVTTATTTFEGVVYAPGTIQGLQDSNHWAGFLVDAIQEQQVEIENLKSGTIVVAKDAQDKWQDIAIGLLILWNIYLTIRKRK